MPRLLHRASGSKLLQAQRYKAGVRPTICRKEKAAGADLIKIFASESIRKGGGMTSFATNPSTSQRVGKPESVIPIRGLSFPLAALTNG